MIDAIMITRHGKYVIKHPEIPSIEGEIYRRRWERLRWVEGAQRRYNHRRKPKRVIGDPPQVENGTK